MLALHAIWRTQPYCCWVKPPNPYLAHLRSQGEEGAARRARGPAAPPTHRHPFAASAAELRRALDGFQQSGDGQGQESQPHHELIESMLRLRLPRDAWGPLPSDQMARLSEANDRV